MDQRFYITLAYSLNTAVEAFGYVYLLTPRFGRLQTALLFVGLVSVPTYIAGPLLKDHVWTWTTVIPTILLLTVLLFRDRFVRKLGIFSLMCLTELFADLMLWPVALALSGSATFAGLQDYVFSPASLVLRLCYALNLLMLITALILLLQRHKVRTFDQRQPALMLFVSIQALAQVVLMAITLLQANAAIGQADVFTLWVLNGCSLFMLGAFLVIALREDRHAGELEAALVRSRVQQQYVQNEAAYEEAARQLREETMQQLDALMASLGKEEDCLPPSVQGQSPQYSDSLAVNALLTHKMAEAQARNIRVDCRSRLEVPALSDFAMCTIVANLLDNAMSSVSEESPWVTLECIRRGGIRSLVCRNSTRPQDLTRRRTRPGPHGLGLSIIRATALEAGGRMYLQSTAGTFSVVLSFSEETACGPAA